MLISYPYASNLRLSFFIMILLPKFSYFVDGFLVATYVFFIVLKPYTDFGSIILCEFLSTVRGLIRCLSMIKSDNLIIIHS